MTMKWWAVLLLSCSSVQAQTLAPHPIVIGGNDEMDACSAVSRVVGLQPSGDGFLAVRNGPGRSYSLKDRLREGDEVYDCVTVKMADGYWSGIIYDRRGQGPAKIGECGVSGTINPARAYRGPCKFGWVKSSWLKVIAG